MPRHAFVATATAIGLAVDAARMPVYLATEAAEIAAAWRLVAVAAAGVLAETFIGMRVLHRIPKPVFRRIVSLLLLSLGVYMIWRGRS